LSYDANDQKVIAENQRPTWSLVRSRKKENMKGGTQIETTIKNDKFMRMFTATQPYAGEKKISKNSRKLKNIFGKVLKLIYKI